MPGGPDGAPACVACGLWLERGTLFCPKCGAAQTGKPGAAQPQKKSLAHETAPGIPAGTPADTGVVPGAVFAGRYRVVELLGKGGMGSVYKVEHVRMNKLMALKVMRPEFSRHPSAAERFAAEAQVVARLTHPNTVVVHDSGEAEDGSLFIAMEYCAGEDLSSLVRTLGRLPSRRAADLTAQVLGALAQAHELGVIHRDVKPANVMLTRGRKGEDVVKVLDFGIAKLAGDVAGVSGGLTAAGQLVGTPNYMSPEQARGDALTPASDLYACGAMLYELVTGKLPFEAPTPMGVCTAHITLPLKPPRQLAPAAGIPVSLEAVILRAMEKEAGKRFADAEEMRAALLKVAAGTDDEAEEPPDPNFLAGPEPQNAYEAGLSFSLDSGITPRAPPSGPSAARLAALEAPAPAPEAGAARSPALARFQEPAAPAPRPGPAAAKSPKVKGPAAKGPAPAAAPARKLPLALFVGLGLAAAVLALGAGGFLIREELAAALPALGGDVAEAEEAVVASVKISSEPTGASVFLDNSPIGKTPVDTVAGFPDGKILWVRVELEGYEPNLTQVVGGQTIQVKARLKRKR